MNKNSKIYIAGHSGLVGSAIWKNLQSKGYTNLIGKSSTELDLRNEQTAAEFFATEKPEYVFLAAAKVGGIVANNTYRAEFIYDNLKIQNNVIHQSYLHGVKKLCFLGSTCIYPRNLPHPMSEDCLLTAPLEYTNEPYSIAKIAGIKLCESYNLQYGTNFISVMPTNLYGKNDNFNLETSHVLPALIRKIHLGNCLQNNDWEKIREDLHKRPIENVNRNSESDEILSILAKYGVSFENKKASVEIWGTGTPMREFLWSEDMADATVFVMENVDFKDTYPKGATEIRNTHINIGTGTDISIKEAVALITEIIDYKGEIYFNASKPDGAMKKLTDVSKLHNLGWKHKVNIKQGIEMLYNWYVS